MSNLIFHQLFEKETSSYTYLLADKKTKEAVIIDPVVEMADRDEKLIKELGLKLLYILRHSRSRGPYHGQRRVKKKDRGQSLPKLFL